MLQGFGEMLKKAREEMKLKPADVNRATKIDPSYIKALEEEDAGVFEKPIYMRLFLRTYAKFLKLDADKITELFEKMPGLEKQEKEDKNELRQEPEKTNEKPDNEHDAKRDARREKPEFTVHNKRNLIIAGAAAAAIIIVLLTALILKGSGAAKNEGESAGVYEVEEQSSIKVIAKARDEVWMKARIDGMEEEFFLQKGENKEWESVQKIVFLVGNAAGVEFIVDGDSIGVIGEQDEVINGLVFQVGKNWYIDRGQGFKTPRKPTPTPTEEPEPEEEASSEAQAAE